MTDDHPHCTGCGRPGYYGVCRDCMTPDYPAEPRNHNVRQPTHNLYNYPNWGQT